MKIIFFKKAAVSVLFPGFLAVLSQHATAVDGIINFSGQVTANTCQISGNGGGASSNNFTVALPPVSTSSLPAGTAAGTTPFRITLTGCGTLAGNVHTFFEMGPTVDSNTGNLIVTGGATNVQVRLLNGDTSAILLGRADAAQNSKSVAIAGGGATLAYMAQYYATGAVGAGAVNTSVMYTLSYN